MKKILIEFECKDNTDKDVFADDLMNAMDNWTDTELDKCISSKFVECEE